MSFCPGCPAKPRRSLTALESNPVRIVVFSELPKRKSLRPAVAPILVLLASFSSGLLLLPADVSLAFPEFFLSPSDLGLPLTLLSPPLISSKFPSLSIELFPLGAKLFFFWAELMAPSLPIIPLEMGVRVGMVIVVISKIGIAIDIGVIVNVPFPPRGIRLAFIPIAYETRSATDKKKEASGKYKQEGEPFERHGTSSSLPDPNISIDDKDPFTRLGFSLPVQGPASSSGRENFDL